MKKIFSITLFLILMLNLIPALNPLVNASPTYWYVSPAGNDSTGDGSYGNPFRSLQKAMNMSNNGDIIYLRKGHYNNIWENINSIISGWEIRRSGISKSKPFIIQTYPGDLPDQAILDGSGYGFTNGYGILTIGRLFTHYSNVTIKDLTFVNSSKQGLVAYATSDSGSCKDIIIQNCTFYNITENAIWFYKESTTSQNPFKNININNCTFDHIQNDASMKEGVTICGAMNAIICYNTFRDVRKINLVFANGCTNCEAYYNNIELTSHHSGEAIYVDAQEYNGAFCSYIRIHNNTIWGYAETTSDNYGIAVCAELSGGIVHNITIENNIVFRSSATSSGTNPYCIGVKHGDVRDITIKYNTCYTVGGGKGCACFYSNADMVKRIIVANNIFFHESQNFPSVRIDHYASTDTNVDGHTGTIFSFFNNLYYSLGDSTFINKFTDTTNVSETGAVIKDPEFVDPSNGDFHLRKTSPCIDAADPDYTVSLDHDCYPRPQKTSFDIGAYEYVLPQILLEVPNEEEALQDGITLQSSVIDPSGVDWVTYSIREPGIPHGTIIDSAYESLPATFTSNDYWELEFDTTQLLDGYYVLYVNASDALGHDNHTSVNFSIRNWAVLEKLPNTPNSKAGRTIPVKFSLRVAAAVDPTQPFVRNEELTLIIYEKNHPTPILQVSTYGTHSTDYRIDSTEEQYITNFKTLKTPTTYVVEIWRIPLQIGSFEFQTTK